MTKFLIASVAVLGFAGVASAQQAPALYGSNYDAAVLNSYSTPIQSGSVVSGSASAIATDRGTASAVGFNINENADYSGK